MEKVFDGIKKANAVCFDVDSTVCKDEGIEVLAKACGRLEEVQRLTDEAMNGRLSFRDSLEKRLDIIRPTSETIRTMRQRPIELSPGVETVIDLLHSRGTHVYLISGGFKSMIQPVAERLKIRADNVYANVLFFDEEGCYAGFDTDQYTSRDGGKPDAINEIKRKNSFEVVVMIGDGTTDLEARPPADFFIGYGGVRKRPAVEQGADWFIDDFEDLAKALRN